MLDERITDLVRSSLLLGCVVLCGNAMQVAAKDQDPDKRPDKTVEAET